MFRPKHTAAGVARKIASGLLDGTLVLPAEQEIPEESRSVHFPQKEFDQMDNVQILRIVVASPGDVQAERNIVEEVATELNRGIAADRGLRLEVTRWETDAYPGFHPEGPQCLIDSILRIEDSHILIGIFCKIFGTPIKDARSGTEHDIRKA